MLIQRYLSSNLFKSELATGPPVLCTVHNYLSLQYLLWASVVTSCNSTTSYGLSVLFRGEGTCWWSCCQTHGWWLSGASVLSQVWCVAEARLAPKRRHTAGAHTPPLVYSSCFGPHTAPRSQQHAIEREKYKGIIYYIFYHYAKWGERSKSSLDMQTLGVTCQGK